MIQKPLTEMTEEELLEELRQLRSRRAMAMENRRGARKSTKVAAGNDFESLFGGTDNPLEEFTDGDVAATKESQEDSDEIPF